MSPNTQNPFVVGTPIAPERFIGRKSIVQTAFSLIETRSNLAVWGGLGTGKTSLLIKIAAPETWKQHNVDSSLAVTIRFSCEEIVPFTPSGFWRKILWLLKDKLEGEPELQDTIHSFLAKNQASIDSLRQILKGLSQKNKFLVLLIDDYDAALVQNSEYSEENMQRFLSECRNLAVHSEGVSNLSIIVTSKKRLNDSGPRPNLNQSPWYNHYLFRQIKPLDDTEIDQLLQPFNRPSTTELRQAIAEITGRHPKLLQIACFFLYQEIHNNKTPQVEEFVQEFEASTQHFFADTWRNCNNKEQTLLMLMALVKLKGHLHKKRHYDLKDIDLIFTQNERNLTNLEEQGVIIKRPSINHGNIPYLFTSSIMEKWVIQEIWNSDEESLVRRQRDSLNFMSHQQVDNMKTAIVWVGRHKEDVISASKFVYPIVEKLVKLFLG